eukprot:6208593-Pyramimonas_sp.AAC.1
MVPSARAKGPCPRGIRVGCLSCGGRGRGHAAPPGWRRVPAICSHAPRFSTGGRRLVRLPPAG